MSISAPAAAGASTFDVNDPGDGADTNTGDPTCDASADPGEQCTLRAAIDQANVASDSDAIHFDLPAVGVNTITLGSQLPTITAPITIDGFTQSDAEPNTNPMGEPSNAILRVELDGENTTNANGFTVFQGAAGSVIRGLVINRFDYSGVNVGGATTVEGNYIGTDATGMLDRGNGDTGVFGSSETITLGGVLPAARNVVSGNNSGVRSNGPVIAHGNYIGVASDGITPLANSAGVGIGLYSSGNVIGGSGEAWNVIANNGTDGVQVWNGTVGNPISSNLIYGNGGIGIELVPDGPADGVTPNDARDRDTGSNELQNYPELHSVRVAKGRTKVTGALNSRPHREFVLEFFSDPQKERGGKVLLGGKNVGTDGKGDAAFTFRFPQKVKKGDFVTATATNENQSTSEFSAPRKARRR